MSGSSTELGHYRVFGIPPFSFLLIVLSIAALIRISTARYSLWFDELASVFFASQSPERLWSEWMTRETNPPLYYSLLHFWIDNFGLSDIVLRLMSVLAGLFSLLASYYFVRRTWGSVTASVVVTMMAISAQHVFFSQQIRAYIFLYLAISISYFGLLETLPTRIGRNAKMPWGWFLYVIGAVIAFYFHTTAILWPFAATISLITVDPRFRRLDGRRWSALIAANLLFLIAAAWWLLITFTQMATPNDNISWIDPPSFRGTLFLLIDNIFLTRQTYSPQIVTPLIILSLAVFGFLRTRGQIASQFTMSVFVILVAIFILVSFRQSIITERTVFWLSLFPLMLSSVGLVSIRRENFVLPAIAAAGLLLTFNLIRNLPRLQQEDWTSVLRKAVDDPKAAVLVSGEGQSVALTMACKVELQKIPCPFPTVVLVRPDVSADTWATGQSDVVSGARYTSFESLRTKQLYLLRRTFGERSDILIFLKRMGTLKTFPIDENHLVGPLPPGFIDDLTKKSHTVNGHFVLDNLGRTASGD